MRKHEEIATAFADRSELDGRKTFFMVGIGGAGMSALARMLQHRWYSVLGTDSTASPETARLIEEGIPVTIGHTGAPLYGLTDVAVVLTDAIDLDSSPEVAAARELGWPIFRRSQVLGWLLSDKKVIAVTGTHGKTTTTGMLGSALIAAGLDPLVVVGANIPQFGGPVREGDGEWAVVEACEAYDSFHDLDPHDVVLTNLELDHVDFHGSYEGLRSSVLRFVSRVPQDGRLIYCAEDEGASEIASLFAGASVGYELNGSAPVEMRVPGRHNRLNMKAALEGARLTGADLALAAEGVVEFSGAERRLQVLLNGPVTVIDDYAHHPTEIEASLRAVRERYFGSGMAVPAMRISGVPPEDSGISGRDAPNTHGRDGHATSELRIRQGANLPHWEKEGATYSVSFRLADAVPKNVHEEWIANRQMLEEQAQSGMISPRERLELVKLLSEKIDAFLDAGKGECILAKPEVADLVQSALKHFDGERYVLHAWCVMPNHVHALFQPLAGHGLEDVLHSWKSFTAHQINKVLQRSGQVWQSEYYDHLVRDESDFLRCVEYIEQNPVKARLADWKWVSTRGMAVPAMGISGVPPEESGVSRRDAHATGRLIVVYQPHLYSRTAPLINEFAQALDLADLVVLTDIYPAREDPIPGVSSARIAEKVTKPVMYVPSRHLLPLKIARIVREGDVVIGMGAGNISEFAPNLIQELKRNEPNHKLKIAVCYAGDSAEREVSILSGRAIHKALTSLGHDTKLVDVTDLLLNKGDVSYFIGPDRPELAFLAVHGTHAEDGAIQGLLELLHIPYTGSSIMASAIAMDKGMTKQVLERNGIRTPHGVKLTRQNRNCDIKPPLIVKPNAQGSTVGLSFVETEDQIEHAIEKAFSYGDEVIVEEWIKGMEISTPVLDDEPLLPVEIAPTSGFYDFEAKYTPGATTEICPARLPGHLIEEARRIALHAHQILGCAGATRTDAMVRGEEIFVLEVNTLPGMTGTSLLPNSAQAMGISFEQLCQRLVEDALRRDAAKT